MVANIMMRLLRRRSVANDEHATHYATRGCHGSTAQCGYEMRGTDAACTGCQARVDRVDRVDSGEDCDYYCE
jgi:hypothetical protein